MGYPGAQAARLPGVSISALVRAAHSEELPEVGDYLYVNSEDVPLLRLCAAVP